MSTRKRRSKVEAQESGKEAAVKEEAEKMETEKTNREKMDVGKEGTEKVDTKKAETDELKPEAEAPVEDTKASEEAGKGDASFQGQETPGDAGVRKSSRLSHKPARSVSELMKPASRSFVKDQMKTGPRRTKHDKADLSTEAEGSDKDQGSQADTPSTVLASAKSADNVQADAGKDDGTKCIMRRRKPKRKAGDSVDSAASSSENGMEGRRSSGEAPAEQTVKAELQPLAVKTTVKTPVMKVAGTTTQVPLMVSQDVATKKLKLSPLPTALAAEEGKKEVATEAAMPLQQKLVIPAGSDILSQIPGLKPGQTIAIVTKDQRKPNSNGGEVVYKTVTVSKTPAGAPKTVTVPLQPTSPVKVAVPSLSVPVKVTAPAAVSPAPTSPVKVTPPPKPSTSAGLPSPATPIKGDAASCKVKVSHIQGDTGKGIPAKLCITWPVGGGKTLIFHIQNYESCVYSPNTTKEEIAADRVLCGVSAVVKPSLLAIPSMPQFLFSQLPSLTGVTFYGRTATASSSVCVTGSLAAVNRAVTLLTQLEKLFPPEYKSSLPSPGVQDSCPQTPPPL